MSHGFGMTKSSAARAWSARKRSRRSATASVIARRAYRGRPPVDAECAVDDEGPPAEAHRADPRAGARDAARDQGLRLFEPLWREDTELHSIPARLSGTASTSKAPRSRSFPITSQSWASSSLRSRRSGLPATRSRTASTCSCTTASSARRRSIRSGSLGSLQRGPCRRLRENRGSRPPGPLRPQSGQERRRRRRARRASAQAVGRNGRKPPATACEGMKVEVGA